VNRGSAAMRAAAGGGRGAPAPAQRAGAEPARLPRRAPWPRRVPAAPGRLRRLRDAPVARAVRTRGNSLLDALLRGPGWIAVIGALLAGIVFFNVDVLRQGRDIADTTERATALEHQNAQAVLEVARLSSSEHVQRAAAARGFVLPPAGEVRYLRARPSLDGKRAAKRLAALPPAPGRWPSPQTTGAGAAGGTGAAASDQPQGGAGPGAPADSTTATTGAGTSAPAGATAAGGQAAAGAAGATPGDGQAAAGGSPAAGGPAAAATGGSPGAGG
jgi:hypothetical protein